MGFAEIEAAGKIMLERFPIIKRAAKRIYQGLSVAASKEKLCAEGDLIRVSPNDDYEYFYGYYDKSPWDIENRYMICLRVRQAYKSVAPKEPGTVCLIDTANNNKLIEIADTHSWNVQQGCMAQWIGSDYKSRIIYNDFREEQYCSVIYNVEKMVEEKVLPLPIYDVSRDGSFALSLDFSRLHRMRPGYGYSNLPDYTKGDLCPDKCCIWKMDIQSGKVTELFKYTDFASFEPDVSMKNAEHKVNHIMISPNGKRFMVLHRWFQKGKKHTRLVTVNVDRSEMYNLSDDIFVSHCFWKNDNEILSFLRKKETGDHYYLMKDQTQEYRPYWPELNTDGHCSYSPNGKFVITDSYPNRKRIASVYLCTEEDNHSRRIAHVFSPFKYDNDCRCDLHPRWNRSGDKICIDSVHEGKRGLYIIRLNTEENVCLTSQNSASKVTIIRSNKFKLISKELEGEQLRIENMFSPLGKIRSIIMDFCLYTRTTMPEKYYNQQLSNLDTDLIIVFDPHCRIQFLQWIKNKNPNVRIILWLWNTVKEIGENIPIHKIPNGIEVWSYSKYDCSQHNLKYNTTFYPYKINEKVQPIKYDVLFVGKDKRRLKTILTIKKNLECRGLRTYFHISPTHKYELLLKHIYQPKIPYDRVSDLISRSKCILDCEVDETAGLTIRPLEALCRHKKLITNNRNVRKEDFYNPNNIFIYGEDDIESIFEFVNSDYVVADDDMSRKYLIEEWVNRFFETNIDGVEE